MGQFVEDPPFPVMRGRDEAALDELYSRFGQLSYGLAVEIVGDGPAAEEIVCAAFVEMWEEREDLRTQVCDARSRLLTAVHRRAAEHLRSSARPEYALPLERESLGRLSGPERDVIDLAYFGCYTLGEIAARLSLSVAAVAAHARAGLARLGEPEPEPAGGFARLESGYSPGKRLSLRRVH